MGVTSGAFGLDPGKPGGEAAVETGTGGVDPAAPSTLGVDAAGLGVPNGPLAGTWPPAGESPQRIITSTTAQRSQDPARGAAPRNENRPLITPTPSVLGRAGRSAPAG